MSKVQNIAEIGLLFLTLTLTEKSFGSCVTNILGKYSISENRKYYGIICTAPLSFLRVN